MTGPELLPCPFCGGALNFEAPVAYFHPVGKCILSGRNFKAGFIGQWNTRAPALDAQIAAEVQEEREAIADKVKNAIVVMQKARAVIASKHELTLMTDAVADLRAIRARKDGTG